MTEQIPRAQQLAGKVIDFSTLVKKLVDEGRLAPVDGDRLAKVTYHDSCHPQEDAARRSGSARIAREGWL
ncbi:MAG: hypothetical protein WDO73_21495 [Ignavibacteriota bacterium]